MVKINGHTYSSKEFEGYKFRYMFTYENGDYHIHNITIYSTDNSSVNVLDLIESRLPESVDYLQIIYDCTKEDDDNDVKFIDENLKGF